MNYLNSIAGGSVSGDSGLQLNNIEILYSKIQRVYIKPQLKEERQRELRVNVEIHAGISPVCRKSLCVLISDDDDPCFLYSLFITEDDFKVLKTQQGLLVDFDNFATQLICLLEQCYVPATVLSKTAPKFLLLLSEESTEWTLKLVETNNFKHLCHLSLNISPASDTDLKTHMAMKIKMLKENFLQKNRETATLEARLTDLTTKLELKSKEYDEFEQKYLLEKSQLQLNSSQQISIEKDRLSQARLEWQRQSEKEKFELEQRHAEILKQLHTDLAELRTQNMSYKDKQLQFEATNKEQIKQLQNLEKELNLAQRDLNQLKMQNTKLEVDFHEKDKTVNSLRTKVAVLEQELKDKALLLSKQTELLKTAKEQKQHLEDTLCDKENQLQRKINSLKNLSDELVKANEILTKLQSELASTKSKLKLRTSIALEQERLLDTKQKEVGQLESKIQSLTDELKNIKTEIENLKDQVKNLQNQLEDKDKIIKNNDNVISWLNRRLADQTTFQNANVPNMMPASMQLTIPRTNKIFSARFDTRTPAPGAQSSTMSNLPSRNPIIQNPNINQMNRSSSRTTGVGISDSTTFNKTGQISSTSTPMERSNSTGKLSNPISSLQPAMENNNHAILTNKKPVNNMQGGLRRAGLTDKPILPSSYFPKTSH